MLVGNVSGTYIHEHIYPVRSLETAHGDVFVLEVAKELNIETSNLEQCCQIGDFFNSDYNHYFRKEKHDFLNR